VLEGLDDTWKAVLAFVGRWSTVLKIVSLRANSYKLIISSEKKA
jgi:hypothetical protein